MAYSIDAAKDNCYPETSCLINKFDIRDDAQLAKTEAAVALAKAALLDQNPLPGTFDFEHYKNIHKYLFDDLYEWAGQPRTINLAKKGTAFVPVNEIDSCAQACFSRLSAFRTDNLTHRELAEEVADLYHTVNMLHPFREGNGRAQRCFFIQWLRSLGYELDLAHADTDRFMIATIYAAQGVLSPLSDFFEQNLKEI